VAANARYSMMPTAVVLNELDEFARQWDLLRAGMDGCECRRVRPRRQFRTSCELWFFENGGRTIRQQSALTRNLSEQGIGLITRCLILQGVPVEVCIPVPRNPSVYLAGVVVFCRYTRRSFHEVGISLKVFQNKPVFSIDPVKAVANLEWLQQALRDLKIASGMPEAQAMAGC
jgi:hypothetical protein